MLFCFHHQVVNTSEDLLNEFFVKWPGYRATTATRWMFVIVSINLAQVSLKFLCVPQGSRLGPHYPDNLYGPSKPDKGSQRGRAERTFNGRKAKLKKLRDI